MRIRTLHAAALGAVVLVLAGCVDGDPLPTLPPTPTSTPVFASEEEALAAAEEAYAAYLEMSNLISSDGGVDPERIAPFVTEERLQDELRGFASYRELGIRTSGAETFDVQSLQRYDEVDEEVEVVVYVCWDASTVRILDTSGNDVTPDDREVVGLIEVGLKTTGGQLPLVLDYDAPWQSGPC